MNRYETATWKKLEKVQNGLATYAPVDILTITGFMDDAQLETHLSDNVELLAKYQAAA